MDNLYVDASYDDSNSTRYRAQSRSRLLIVAIAVLLIGIGWYALRFIPAFDIQTIVVNPGGGSDKVPAQAAVIATSLKGASLVSLQRWAVRSRLETIAVVERAVVKRRWPATVEITLEMASPDAILAAIGAGGKVESILMVVGEHITELTFEEFLLYRDSVFTVQISPLEAAYVGNHGLDAGLRSAIRIAKEMGMQPDERYNLITKIKYDNNDNNGFGRLVLSMPSLNAQLNIRESVSEERVREAVRLIQQEHARDKTRNIALAGELRYDLYSNSLVARQ